MTKCECGCGQIAKEGKRFIKYHHNKGKNNPMYGKKGGMFGKTHTPANRKKMSKRMSGKNNPMYGSHRTGKDNPMFGKKRPDTTERMKKNNPMKRPELVEKSIETKRKSGVFKKFSEKMKCGKAVYICSFIKNSSKPQVELFNFIKSIYSSAKLNYPVKIRTDRHFSLDVAIPELKVNYEYDGGYWHDKVKDLFRDEALMEKGWAVVRINSGDNFEKHYGI